MAGTYRRRDVLRIGVVGISTATAAAMLGACQQLAPTTPQAAGGGQAAPAKSPKLRQWMPVDAPDPAKFFQPMADKWAASSKSTIELLQIPYAEYETKYLSSFAARDSAPDIFYGIVSRWAGGTTVADPAPDAIAKRLDKEFLEALAPGYKIGGKWFGATQSGTVGLGPMLIYNPDDFQEVGLDPTKPPKTMDEMLEYARKLTKRDASGTVVRSGFAHRYDGALGAGIGGKFIPFLHAFGGKIYDPETGKADGVTNSPEAIAALEYCTKYTVGEKLSSLTFGVPEQQFGQKKASMMFREGHMIGWLPANFPGIKFEFAPIPKAKTDGMGITGTDSWAPLVYKFSPNKDMAWDFLDKVVFTADADVNNSKYMGTVPGFKANWESEYMRGRKDYAAQQYALGHSAGIMYQHARTAELTDRQAQAVQEALLGKKSPKEALDAAAADMEKIRAKQ
jgi:multiple sugar transport system substrate-binding protein